MVDNTLALSQNALLWFHAKQIFWLYLFPVIMGFVSVLCMQIYMRVGQMGNVKARTAFLLAAGSAMINVWGWAHMARTPAMIPAYGCGVGSMAALMTRVYAIALHQRWGLRVPTVIWKGNPAAAAEFRAQVSRTYPSKTSHPTGV